MRESSSDVAAESSLPLPTAEQARMILDTTLGQIRFARQYTLQLLQATPRSLWFQRVALPQSGAEGDPSLGSSCIAWQVGHLTFSQYGLLMFRIHGRAEGDMQLFPSRFRKAFARGSDPAAAAVDQWSAEELLQRMEAVHQAALAGLGPSLPTDVLFEPVDMPYAVYPIKLGAILFCPLHEQIHAGQIGLIRRLLGLPPVR